MAVDDRGMLELPTDADSAWPPKEYAPIIDYQRVWGAWYSGDENRLEEAYANVSGNSPVGRAWSASTGEPGMPAPRPGQYRGGAVGAVSRFFWGKPTPPGEKRAKYHVPIASDIAATSAELLYSEPLAVTAKDAGNQAVLDDLMDDGMHAKFQEAEELATGLGGVYLRVVWNTDVAEFPWIDLVAADAAVPQFSYGKLMAVTFWRIIDQDGKKVVRHLEKHVPGQNVIHHGVFVGDDKKIGDPRPLTDFAETAPFASVITSGQTIEFPDEMEDASSVVYIPNLLPNRLFRDLGSNAAPVGRSDYANVTPLMDGLDETYSSWMRDIDLAKARITVPQQYLDNLGPGDGAVFDTDRRIYSPLGMLGIGGAQDLQVSQFAIRAAEHQQTATELVQQIIRGAGYAGATFGEYDGGGPITATEVEQRNQKTLKTRGRKILYRRPRIQDILYGLLAVRAHVFGDDTVTPERPQVDFPRYVLPNQQELANTASVLGGAELATKKTLVRLIHPDWTDDQVNAEVTQIWTEVGYQMLMNAQIALQEPQGNPSDLAQQEQQIADGLGEPKLPVPATTPPPAAPGPPKPVSGGTSNGQQKG